MDRVLAGGSDDYEALIPTGARREQGRQNWNNYYPQYTTLDYQRLDVDKGAMLHEAQSKCVCMQRGEAGFASYCKFRMRDDLVQ